MKLPPPPPALPPDAAAAADFDAGTLARELAELLGGADPLTGEKARFGTHLPPQTLLYLHRLAHWSRDTLTDIVDAALLHYLHSYPTALAQARRPLPEKERRKRKMPRC